jgi:hypothetical protein
MFHRAFTLIGRLFGHWDGEKVSTALLRLLFYIVALTLWGWVLYVGLNCIKSFVMVPVDEECWYGQLIQKHLFHGRIFDFSNHTVLYMAQILPLPLMETLHSLAMPFGSSARGSAVLMVSGLKEWKGEVTKTDTSRLD